MPCDVYRVILGKMIFVSGVSFERFLFWVILDFILVTLGAILEGVRFRFRFAGFVLLLVGIFFDCLILLVLMKSF